MGPIGNILHSLAALVALQNKTFVLIAYFHYLERLRSAVTLLHRLMQSSDETGKLREKRGCHSYMHWYLGLLNAKQWAHLVCVSLIHCPNNLIITKWLLVFPGSQTLRVCYPPQTDCPVHPWETRLSSALFVGGAKKWPGSTSDFIGYQWHHCKKDMRRHTDWRHPWNFN